mmetsp:Transcript_9691/g.21666  ORF Transcript_9691/g.21666 Transcript_9691/m.21666 type:complete len:313 (-) Transcript_9691:267-1205(-)
MRPSLLLAMLMSQGLATHNQLAGLLPHTGGWRGSTLGGCKSVKAYEDNFGYKPHLVREFLTEHRMEVTDEVKAYVEAGGILWYNVAPTNWAHAASPEYASQITEYAKHVSQFAPALVMVCVRHEPDTHMSPGAHHDPYGTAEEYQAMWRAFREGFEAAGVKNALWVMDYSRAILDKTFDNVEKLWPGDEVVDWLFFNTFGDHPAGKPLGNFTEIVGGIYKQLEESSGPGHNYNRVPWGVGAFDPKPSFMSNHDRAVFFDEASAALDSGIFPRIRALVKYTCDAMTGEELTSYKRYLGREFFAVNDRSEEVIV